MKKKNIYILSIIALVILIIIVYILVIVLPNKKIENESDKKAIKLERIDTNISKSQKQSYVIKNYEDLSDRFMTDEIDENDFKNKNLAIIEIEYNPCGENNIEVKDYTISGNKIDLNVQYESKCGVCAEEILYYAIKVDKNIEDIDVDIHYKSTNTPNCNPDISYKPMIYLYPSEKINVEVKLINKEYLTTTYPKYEDSWNVVAYPDGTLIDNKTKRELYGLYWEGNNHNKTVQKDGFIVKGEDSISFLEEKLKILGLTDKEADEFIIYWLPKLEVNNYNYIRFETINEINEYMPLEINPKPDNIIRIQMNYKPLKEKINVKEQNLTSPERNGFTVVEWGGSLIN